MLDVEYMTVYDTIHFKFTLSVYTYNIVILFKLRFYYNNVSLSMVLSTIHCYA